jgi:hypothetical protein
MDPFFLYCRNIYFLIFAGPFEVVLRAAMADSNSDVSGLKVFICS